MENFEQGPSLITKIHTYLARELNLTENEEEKSAELIVRMCQITLEVPKYMEGEAAKNFRSQESTLKLYFMNNMA